MAVVAVESIDIGMSIKKRLDICQRSLLGCFNKSMIELLLSVPLLVRCHWSVSLMFAQYRLNQIQSNVQRYSTATRSSIVVFQTHSIASNEVIARGTEGGRRCERGRGSEQQRDGEILCGSLSLSYLVCVSRSIDDSHDSLRE